MSYLEDAFQKVVDDMPIISKGTIRIGEYELPIIAFDFSMDVSYAPFTEYGYRPEPANIIDSDAIVIDPDVLALPAPEQKEVEECKTIPTP